MPVTQRTARWTVFVGLLVQVLCWAPAVAAQDPEAVTAPRPEWDARPKSKSA